MATKLNGRLNLSKVPKGIIQTAQDGSKFIYVDVVERRTPGKYGDTHSITAYDKDSRQTIYLADLKPMEFGGQQQPAPVPAPVQAPAEMPVGDSDLPF